MATAASRLHVTGGVLFILTGIAHTLGQFLPGPPDAGSAAIEHAMRGSSVPGTSFTYWNVMQCWGALYGGMTFLFGALLLVVLRASASEPRVRTASAWVGATAATLQAVVSIAFRTPPPAFFMVPAAIAYGLAATLPARRVG